MIKTILPGSGNTGGIMTPLIHFDIIFDTDVGLLCLILRDYMNPEVFNKDFFFGKKVKELVYELYIRKENNPIDICINDSYKNKADDFYRQFMEEKYNEILELSVFTEFYRLIRAFQNESDIKATILCDREEQVTFLGKYNNTKKCDIFISNSLNKVNIKRYNQFYFKRIDDSSKFANNISNKTVYFANYGFNRNDNNEIKDHDLIVSLSETNVINLIDVYNMDKLKGGLNSGGN